MQVMTWNLRYGTAHDGPNRWEMRRELLVECLKRYPSDMIGTQEGLGFQLELIKAELGCVDYVGVGRYHGVETDREHETGSGEHCAIFYDTRKWQVCSHDTFWLSDTPQMPASCTWGNDLPRVVTWAIFERAGSPIKIAVLNTHYHWGEPMVTNSTQLLLRRLREIAGGLPTILMGDFNQEPDSLTYRALTEQTGLMDCWRACGRNERDSGTVHAFDGAAKGRIDWLLASQHFQPRHIERITFNRAGRYPSDHFPVRAELHLSEANSSRREVGQRDGPKDGFAMKGG